MEKRLEARVHGLVQGVFFRHFTQIKAGELGLVGTVSNQPDGTVLVVAEGARSSLESLLEWLGHGPDLAHVKRVDITWSPAQSNGNSFEVIR